MKTFQDLGVIDPILRALDKKKYHTPTEIQAKAIPKILQRRDILGSAQTGTGKTAAFAIPMIQHIADEIKTSKYQDIKGLIITPTRELAIQIEENIKLYAEFTEVEHTVIFGGVKQMKQVQRIDRGVDILVATPGRLLDLIDQGIIDIGYVNYFVLDEADRMLDMGFIHDINKILKLLPKKRQSLFFSATMPKDIVQLSQRILDNPEKIEVKAVSSAADTLQQYVYFTNKADKRTLLLHILKKHSIDQVLIFARTKHGSDKIAKYLKKQGINCMAIHGDKAQNARQKALGKFKDGELRALVATDIAARGIDIDKLKFVINYDVPNISETYVHRIGRSGRAGETGTAISIAEPEENEYVRGIEKLINQKIPVIEDHPFPQTDKPMTEQEKKAFEKEKNRKKQEFFANRKKNQHRR